VREATGVTRRQPVREDDKRPQTGSCGVLLLLWLGASMGMGGRRPRGAPLVCHGLNGTSEVQELDRAPLEKELGGARGHNVRNP
jgi:hypothetical protein